MTHTEAPPEAPLPVPPSGRARRAAVDDRVHAVLLRQAGVISRAQAMAAGMSADTVDRRLATRRWHPVHPRVYRDDGYPESDRTRVRAAVLWAGEGAVLSGAAAAWWQGIVPRPPSTVGVTVPRRRYPRARPGLRVRRRELDPLDVLVLHGVRVTAPASTVLETAVELGGDEGAEFLDRVLAGAAIPFTDLAAAHARNLSAQGAATAGRLLAGATRRAVDAADRRLCALLRSAGIGGWTRAHTIAGLPLELAFPVARIAVQVRHRVASADPGCDSAQRWRRAVLRRHGWRVLLVDPADLAARPRGVLDAVLRAVREGARACDPGHGPGERPVTPCGAGRAVVPAAASGSRPFGGAVVRSGPPPGRSRPCSGAARNLRR